MYLQVFHLKYNETAMNNEDKTEQIPTFEPEQNDREPHRKLNVTHLVIIILVAVAIILLIVILSMVFHSKSDDSNTSKAEISETATPSPTPTPTATPDEDFYHDSTPGADTDDDEDSENTDNKSTDTNTDLPLYQTYDNINLNSGISITAKADQGELKVIAEDADGNQTVLFDETGPFDKSDVRTDLSSGTYSVSIYTDATGWSWSYSTY